MPTPRTAASASVVRRSQDVVFMFNPPVSVCLNHRSRHTARGGGPARQAADRPLPLVTQKPAQQRLAGRLALAAFVKRPQADVQIGAGRDHTNILTLLKSVSHKISSNFSNLQELCCLSKDKLAPPKRSALRRRGRAPLPAAAAASCRRRAPRCG